MELLIPRGKKELGKPEKAARKDENSIEICLYKVFCGRI